MYILRLSNDRGQTLTDWLNSRHTFSFGNYFNPDFRGFSDLLVINDDIVAPSQGFGMHPHDNMEIISIVLSGMLEHRDSLGNGSVVKPGEIQKMSAGFGITHSEYNPSTVNPVHFLQIWIMPEERNLPPSYEQKKFGLNQTHNQLCLVAANEENEEIIRVHQDVRLYQSILDCSRCLSYTLKKSRAVWIQVAQGSIMVNDNLLMAGDGFGIWDEDRQITIQGADDRTNFLLFDLSGE